MVEDDGGVREFRGEVGKLGNLRMEEPGVEAQSVFREPREALAESAVEQQTRRKVFP